ncbi:PQQ-dependent sugar dehydrogenase [Erythrobacter sp.]|uniref:PQQ-dependent sugar dehydrogenase n=1 Tax=Erythrobacter sp. TaxID=1042 RepID=UPI001B2A78B9|nr:PQQ-dependent sugar dehydrogenase [Erythrobacter sp.]MBO6527324.1 sorbosone dehydrogenase family protein [Erythrobacter sp.]MBO6530930.1 sorbosone dehydrogenase family protein [Erythrobacter sp.]
MGILKKLGIALLVILLVVLVAGYFLTRGDTADVAFEETVGTDPTLDEPAAESFPTVAIAEPVGWAEGEVPVAAEGLAVNRFAEGLDHPRTLQALPNGDILAALTQSPKIQTGESNWLRDLVAGFLFRKAGAGGDSANQIVLLRDADGDGIAEGRFVLRDDLDSPSGIAWGDDTLYIANHDEVLAFDYELGSTELSGEGRKIADLAHGTGHWMRNLALHPDGDRLYAAVGSKSNIGEDGMEIEEGRALIWEIDLESGRQRVFGAGLRNANGMDFSPWSGELWTTVNERDMLGSDLVPDYLTNVPVGAHYGWPWVYFGDNFDRRVEYPIPQFINYVRTPEYALGPHVAALGLVFSREGARMGERFSSGAFIAQHGSWNRKPPSGYDVVYVAFDERGNPTGKPLPVLTGFLKDDGTTRGRPTWVEWAGDGSLLVSDDTAGIVWRVVAPEAEAQAGIDRVTGNRLPARRELRGQEATFGEDDYARRVTAE